MSIASRRSLLRPLLLAIVIGWTLAFYSWAVAPEWRPGLVSREAWDYHGLQTRGFLKGQLAMDVDVDPVLATLDNPWDPEQRAGRGLADATYYKSQYYLYFGVTPILLLFLPFKLLTGYYLGEPLACLVFAVMGFGFAVWLLRLVRQRYFPNTSAWMEAGCVLALGLATMMPVLLRRPSMWEVPITCGNACLMLAFVCLFQALHSERRGAWLVWCSVALALAVGARHTYLVTFIAPAYVLWLWRPTPKVQLRVWLADRAWRANAAAIIVPAAAIGLGLAAYNYLRFDDPLEFGRTYQLSSEPLSTAQSIRWEYFWFGLRIYLLTPAGFSPFFPFVTVITPPAAPAGYYGVENPYGMIPNLPFVLLAAGVFALGRAGGREPELRLKRFAATILFAAGALGLTLMGFFAATNRYMVYFVPSFILLACVGWLTLVSRDRVPRLVRGVVAGVGVALLVYSVGFNLLVSIQHNNLLRVNHPTVYESLARRANAVAPVLDGWGKAEYGPLELEVIFPPGLDGGAEPLVVTGTSFLSDYVYVIYGRNTVRFGFEHTSYGGFTSAPVKIEPGRPYRIRIEMGSLYPPAEHPYFDDMPPEQVRLRRNTLRVTLDDRQILQRVANFYDATEWSPSIGTSAGRPGFVRPFSGKIVSWRRRPEAAPLADSAPVGPLRIELTVPKFTGRRSEPLVSMGTAGQGDLVYITYEGASRISIGHDHWGYGGTMSRTISINPAEILIIEIDAPAMRAPVADTSPLVAIHRHLVVRVNGQLVLKETERVHDAAPETLVVAGNPLQFTTAEAGFSGTIHWVSRLAEPLE